MVLGTGPALPGPDPGTSTSGVHMRTARRRASAALRVQLLGRIEIAAQDGSPIRLSGRHAQALFALLVLSRRPRSRDALATDLWPDSDAASSAALRQALWLVRNAFSTAGFDADAILEVESETIGLRPDARIDLDADRFEVCARSDDCGTETAVGLYRGDLAEGLGHDCFASERERLSDLYEDALSDVGEQRLREGDLAGARGAAEALLAKGAKAVYAYATHGVLSGGAVARIRESKLKSLVVTDSIAATEEMRKAPNIRRISIAPLLGEAIDRIANEKSVSTLFD